MSATITMVSSRLCQRNVFVPSVKRVVGMVLAQPFYVAVIFSRCAASQNSTICVL